MCQSLPPFSFTKLSDNATDDAETMKKFGLIGNPIKTSLSPALFTAGYNGKYTYDLIEEADFETAYRKFLDEYSGINVTAPFKMDAFRQADRKSDVCLSLGAANLILKDEDGKTSAHNTDFAGIILSILEAILPESGFEYFNMYGQDFSSVKEMLPTMYGHKPKALIAGCGGAGRAAAAAAASIGYETMLLNRTVSKALRIAEEMPEHNFKTGDMGMLPQYLEKADLLIYTIPERIPELDILGKKNFGGHGKIILEANYKNPSFGGKEQKIIHDTGGIYVSGKRWLLYQALAGFKLFTGENPDFEKMSAVL